MTSLIWPSSRFPATSASRAIFSITGQLVRRYFWAKRLRRQLGLQNAALPRIPVRDQKGYRLRPLDDLLLGGFGSYPHPLFLCERLIGPSCRNRHQLPRPVPFFELANEMSGERPARADRPWPSGSVSACHPRLAACCGPPRPASGATHPLSSVAGAWSTISIVP